MICEMEKFDFESFKSEALAKLKAGESPLGKEGVLTPLIKAFLEEALEGELESHLSETRDSNRKNGKTKKKVRSSYGEIELSSPRDRAGSFQPKIVAKRQKNLPNDIERQIFALYARGSSMGDIRDFIEDIYGVEISPATISRITDKVLLSSSP
ncbi:MAG: transposase [Bacteroidota bacterium]